MNIANRLVNARVRVVLCVAVCLCYSASALAQTQLEYGYNDPEDGAAAEKDAVLIANTEKTAIVELVEELMMRRKSDKKDITLGFNASLGSASGRIEIRYDKGKGEPTAKYTPSLSSAIHKQFAGDDNQVFVDISSLKKTDVDILSAVVEIVRIGANKAPTEFLLNKSKKRVAESLDISMDEAEQLLVTKSPEDGGVERSQQVADNVQRILSTYPEVSFSLENFPASDTKYRMWIDVTGKFRVDAKLVASNDTAVQIERRNGEVVSVPLARLSQIDQRYVKNAK